MSEIQEGCKNYQAIRAALLFSLLFLTGCGAKLVEVSELGYCIVSTDKIIVVKREPYVSSEEKIKKILEESKALLNGYDKY